MFGGVIFIWLFFVGLMAKQLKLYNIENVNGVIVRGGTGLVRLFCSFQYFG